MFSEFCMHFHTFYNFLHAIISVQNAPHLHNLQSGFTLHRLEAASVLKPISLSERVGNLSYLLQTIHAYLS